MTEGGRGRVRGRDVGEGALMDPNRRAWGCLYVYVTSQPQQQPVCIDRVQTECLYQSFMRQPLGTRCLPAQRDSPLSGPLSSTEKAQEESNSHTSRASPHCARIWTDTGGSALSKKGETITNMPPRRLTSHGLIMVGSGGLSAFRPPVFTPLRCIEGAGASRVVF